MIETVDGLAPEVCNPMVEAQARIAASGIPHNWTFKDGKVAAGFQRHVRESLPWYDLATGAVAHIARHFIPEGGTVYDIGASVGNIGNCIRTTLDDRKANFIPIEASQQMCDLYEGPGSVVCADAMTYDYKPYDCTIIFLVLMFMPPAKRLTWLTSVLNKMNPGGCLILFDKFHMASSAPYMETILRRMTLAGKVATGIPAEEIVAKELSLCGVQRPLDHKAIEMMAPHPRLVFQFGEFAGYVFTRPETGSF